MAVKSKHCKDLVLIRNSLKTSILEFKLNMQDKISRICIKIEIKKLLKLVKFKKNGTGDGFLTKKERP